MLAVVYEADEGYLIISVLWGCITFGYKGEKIEMRKIGVQFVPGAKYRKMVTTGQVHMEVSNINRRTLIMNKHRPSKVLLHLET